MTLETHFGTYWTILEKSIFFRFLGSKILKRGWIWCKKFFLTVGSKGKIAIFYANCPPPSLLGGKNIDFFKIVQYVPKCVSRGIFRQNFHFLALKKSKLPFYWRKSSNKAMSFFLKNPIFFTFLR